MKADRKGKAMRMSMLPQGAITVTVDYDVKHCSFYILQRHVLRLAKEAMLQVKSKEN